MTDSPVQRLTRRFEARPDPDGVAEMARTTAPGEQRYIDAFAVLAHAFAPLAFGEAPLFDALDRHALESRRDETLAIADALAGSDLADRRTAAIGLMGALGWRAFVPVLRRLLDEGAAWQRIAALHALASIDDPAARALLRQGVDDAEPEVRAQATSLIGSGATP